MKPEFLLPAQININSENLLLLFRGLFVIVFLLIISFTKDDGKKEVEKMND